MKLDPADLRESQPSIEFAGNEPTLSDEAIDALAELLLDLKEESLDQEP